MSDLDDLETEFSLGKNDKPRIWRKRTAAHILEQRTRTHCPAGHPYDAQNTIRREGKRKCRACQTNRQRERRRRQRAASA